MKANADMHMTSTCRLFTAAIRDEVDKDKFTTARVGVVQETMQPEWVSLWLKPTNDRGRATADGSRSKV